MSVTNRNSGVSGNFRLCNTVRSIQICVRNAHGFISSIALVKDQLFMQPVTTTDRHPAPKPRPVDPVNYQGCDAVRIIIVTILTQHSQPKVTSDRANLTHDWFPPYLTTIFDAGPSLITSKPLSTSTHPTIFN